MYNINELDKRLKKGAEILLSLFSRPNEKRKIVGEQAEEFSVIGDYNSVTVKYTRIPEFFRGVGYAIANAGKNFSVSEKCAFSDYGYMIDLSRNGVMTVDAIKKTIRKLALMGYTSVQLYTEDTYEVEGEPYFGYLRGRMTESELKDLDEYAKIFGIELVPCVQTLGHLSRLFRWRRFYEVCDGYDVLLPKEEKTYDLIDKAFASLRRCFSTDKINMCMDETSSVALGAFWDKYGPPENRLETFTDHLGRVNELAKKHGFKFPMMWSDVFLWIDNDYEVGTGKKPVSERIRAKVPENVTLVNWCYVDAPYIKDVLKSHLSFNRDVCYAGTIWRFGSPAPHNRISMNYIRYQTDACVETGIKKFLLTAWGDNGNECAFFAGLPTLYSAIEYAYGNGEDKTADRFKKLFGCSLENMLMLDYANFCKDYPDMVSRHSKYMLFSGYFDNDFLLQVEEEYAADCALYAEKLKKAKQSAGEWRYLFETQETLCRLLSLKIDVSQKTKRAYKEGDKEKIRELIKTHYRPLVSLYGKLADKMRSQWEKECKPHGFDVIELRLGGMVLRTKDAVARLEKWTEGKITSIPELEEETLSFLENPERDFKPIKQAQFEEIYSKYKL